jgi:multiple sugar transport system substrate-binding protein
MEANMTQSWLTACLVLLTGWIPLAQGADGPDAKAPARPESTTVTVGQASDVPVPRVLPACPPGKCMFAGQKVTVIATKSAISVALLEVKEEFEAATGAQLDIVRMPGVEHYPTIISDMTNHTGRYDASIAAAWWVGDMVAGGHLLSYEKFYNDPRFPKWDIDDVLPGPRTLLSYGGKKYMVAYDHDGQVLYYRRDLLNDPRHQAAFKQKYGYPLAVPQTWAQLRDEAQYFNGQDLNGDGTPDHGIVLALLPGSQGMFNYMTLSASFVIGPTNARLYWFDPQTMEPLIRSPGHARALEAFVDLVKSGPREMLTWDHGRGWDHFLRGVRAQLGRPRRAGSAAGQPSQGQDGCGAGARHARVLRHRAGQMGHHLSRQPGGQYQRCLLGRGDLQILQGARGRLLPVGAAGHEGEVAGLRGARLGRHRPGAQVPHAAA